MTDPHHWKGGGKQYFNKYVYGNILLGLLVPSLLTLFDWPFRDLLTSSNILMFYLLGVFFIALHFGFLSSILASFTSAVAFAFFFAPPIFSLEIADQENLVGLIVMLVIGVVTSNQAENIRNQAKVAAQRERRASALYNLSKELAEARLEIDISDIGLRHINAEFGGENLFLFPDSEGRLSDSVLLTSHSALHSKLVLDIAEWVLKNGEMAGNGLVHFSSEALRYMPLNGSTGCIGVLVLESKEDGLLFLSDQRQLLDTYVNQIVHALERARSAEQAKTATLKMQAETLRSSLLSSISHDLRNPLATIVGAASTLDVNAAFLDNDGKKKLLTVIIEEAQRMSDLTIKILDMARLEAGEVVLNKQWYTPEEIIGSAIRRLDKKLKDRKINIVMPEHLALIHVDAVLLQQVLVNLLDNADKYSPLALPIDILVEPSQIGLVISVADHGIGINEIFQQKVFEKFFRIHEESAQSGVGLGLSICRAIVEAHAGKIQVTNRSGGGALFKIYLPVLECPPSIDLEEKDDS